MRTIARALAEHAHSISFRRIPAGVRERAKELFLDWLGCAIGGAKGTVARVLAEVLGSRGSSTAIPGMRKMLPAAAAACNAAASHELELDDVHMGGIIHVGSVVFPAALAICEDRGLPGRALIEAAVAGYEVAIRIAMAAGRGHYALWHTTGTCGSFGAAVAASKAMGMDAEGTAKAMGVAGILASGLWEYITIGSSAKPLMPAHASWLGVVAAYASSRGVRGPYTVLEGERGFFKAMAPGADPRTALEDLDRYRIMEVSIKPYPSCRHTHSAIEAAIKLHGAVEPSRVARVVVRTYPEAVRVAGLRSPQTVDEARFSLSYCVAVALRYGRFTLSELESGLRDPLVARIEAAVSVEADEDVGTLLPKQPAHVRVVTDAGSAEQYVEVPKGDPANPLTRGELVEKFAGLSSWLLGSRAEEVAGELMRIERLDVIDLLEVLAP